MLPLVLVACGAVVVVATLVVARATRRTPTETPTAADDPWAAFTPRTTEEVEQEGRMRLWPLAGSLAGVLLLLAGLVAAQSQVRVAPEPTPDAIAIELDTPDETASPEPSPTESAAPSPTTSAGPAATRTPAATRKPAPSRTATPRPTASPTPRPTPTPKPGPSVNGSTSCVNRNIHLGYSVNARQGTTISSISVALDGKIVQQPPASGRSTFNSNYGQSGMTAGTHRFTVTARGSDGGVTTRSFQTTC